MWTDVEMQCEMDTAVAPTTEYGMIVAWYATFSFYIGEIHDGETGEVTLQVREDGMSEARED